jgi:hypothetical protein
MIWTLVLVTGINMNSILVVGYFEYEVACQKASQEWRNLGYKVGCVQTVKHK